MLILAGGPVLAGAPGFAHRTTETLMDALSVAGAAEAAEALWRHQHRAALEPQCRRIWDGAAANFERPSP